MADRAGGLAYRQIGRLFGAGTLAGLSERQLLGRFLADRDELAFAALVERFGPMVAGICRRWLADPADVDDAFQATFLVLVRRARSIRDPDLLGNWLYGVAVRVARRARTEVAGRRLREGPWQEPAAGEGAAGERNLRSSLDEEIGRLPEKYRRPLVLCYLEGLTHEEAADRLGCPVGTVRSRMARARDRLRDRLRACHAAVPAGLLAADAAELSSPVPRGLVESTARSAVSSLAGAAGAASSRVLSLTQGVVRAMKIQSIRSVGAVAVAGVMVLGVGVGIRAASGPPVAAIPAQGTVGQVPQGRPAPGGPPAVADPTRWPGMAGMVAPGLKNVSLRTELLTASLSPGRDQVWVHSLETGTWSRYRAPQGTKINPIATGTGGITSSGGFGGAGAPGERIDLMALDVTGDRIGQVAAIGSRSKTWRTQDLVEPATTRIWPLVSGTIAVYSVGRHVYAYSSVADRWDVLALKAAPEKTAQPTITLRSAIVEEGDSIHIFNAGTGKWESADVGQDGTEEQQGEPGCGPPVEGTGESGEPLARCGERMRGCHGWLRSGV